VQVNKTDNIQLQINTAANQRAVKQDSTVADTLKIDSQYDGLVNKALELASSEDEAAIEQAKKLIASGQLDSPQAAYNAARNIVDLGI
jgi:hypothetical protein